MNGVKAPSNSRIETSVPSLRGRIFLFDVEGLPKKKYMQDTKKIYVNPKRSSFAKAGLDATISVIASKIGGHRVEQTGEMARVRIYRSQFNRNCRFHGDSLLVCDPFVFCGMESYGRFEGNQICRLEQLHADVEG